ncbi:hypothetical protein ACFVHB_35860 [Kitasatospora sp. NPDC127111]|uniref:hypothetical protein n=1 Tax=Kitasatospora sp. NPDC127111 TaxID=3345363 RepID=UPI00362FC6D7
MSGGWDSPRLSEDMQMRLVDGGPVDYTFRTERPVEYVAVANDDGTVLGYLWGCDADDAAGWKVRRAAGSAASNVGGYWYMKLRDAKSRGLLPSQALAELSAEPMAGRVGKIVPGSRTKADSLEKLQELALQGWNPPAAEEEQPRNGRR